MSSDYDAIPQMGLALHPENAQGISRQLAQKIYAALLAAVLRDLRNEATSPQRRKAHYKWMMDAVVRRSPLAGTFRLSCMCAGITPETLLKKLMVMFREDVASLFGDHVPGRVWQWADTNEPVPENQLATLMGGRRSRNEGGRNEH